MVYIRRNTKKYDRWAATDRRSKMKGIFLAAPGLSFWKDNTVALPRKGTFRVWPKAIASHRLLVSKITRFMQRSIAIGALKSRAHRTPSSIGFFLVTSQNTKKCWGKTNLKHSLVFLISTLSLLLKRKQDKNKTAFPPALKKNKTKPRGRLGVQVAALLCDELQDGDAAAMSGLGVFAWQKPKGKKYQKIVQIPKWKGRD